MSVRREDPLRRVRMSWEEFLELPEWPRAEWVDGEVVMLVAPPVFDHGTAQTQLTLLLAPLFPDCWVVPGVFLALPCNRVRLPDLMLVAERPADGWVRAAPILVVEVLSPSTRSEDTIRKSMEYAEGGAQQHWVVDPDLRAIDLWRNVDGEWTLLARVDDDRPTAEVELAGVTVPIDLRQILRD
ncbi:Uma2 family endonuclease [Nocardioides sp. W7]|uniref:Uma2 family endonuclease n=1 Tax=Nocardioides sp. W7 TaxID=2931390 RepID=UPI001FD3CAA0|nr:Uma2 family endonuclease [Nocardioides sp. W7]